jgi:hypothetical protein
MNSSAVEGRSCLKQHQDHLPRLDLGQQSQRLHGKAVANSQKVMAAVNEAVKQAAVKEAAVKEAACNWKELDLKDEMMST